MWRWRSVVITCLLSCCWGCSKSEEAARTSFERFALDLESQLPDLVTEYDEDAGRDTKLSVPMTWAFDKANQRDSAHKGTIEFGMHVTTADGVESEVAMLSHYAYQGGKWVCKGYEITSGENEPVKVVGEDLRSSGENSKLGSALVNIE
jgi:hypothetical protein